MTAIEQSPLNYVPTLTAIAKSIAIVLFNTGKGDHKQFLLLHTTPGIDVTLAQLAVGIIITVPR